MAPTLGILTAIWNLGEVFEKLERKKNQIWLKIGQKKISAALHQERSTKYYVARWYYRKKSHCCIYVAKLDTFILWKANCWSGISKTGSERVKYCWGAFLQLLLQWKNNNYYLCWVCICYLRYPAFNAKALYWYLWPARFYIFFHLFS